MSACDMSSVAEEESGYGIASEMAEAMAEACVDFSPGQDGYHNACAMCGEGGLGLAMCDNKGCPLVFHVLCTFVPESGTWHCPPCSGTQLPYDAAYSSFIKLRGETLVAGGGSGIGGGTNAKGTSAKGGGGGGGISAVGAATSGRGRGSGRGSGSGSAASASSKLNAKSIAKAVTLGMKDTAKNDAVATLARCEATEKKKKKEKIELAKEKRVKKRAFYLRTYPEERGGAGAGAGAGAAIAAAVSEAERKTMASIAASRINLKLGTEASAAKRKRTGDNLALATAAAAANRKSEVNELESLMLLDTSASVAVLSAPAFETFRLNNYARLVRSRTMTFEQFARSTIYLIRDASDDSLLHIAATVLTCASDLLEEKAIDFACYEEIDVAAGAARRRRKGGESQLIAGY